MATFKELEFGKVLMGRLTHDKDILEELTDLCVSENIRLGWLQGLGAVKKARLGFYNQTIREYQYFEIDKPLEITKLVGNISLKDGKPMIHAHITLADSEGNAYGGHLASGTIVFACEFSIATFKAHQAPFEAVTKTFTREFDEETGLTLWKK